MTPAKIGLDCALIIAVVCLSACVGVFSFSCGTGLPSQYVLKNWPPT